MGGPLHNIKVIELAGIGPGPFACMLLADMGAEVIRIERMSGSNSPNFEAERKYQVTYRNRPAIAVDLKHPSGVELVLSLVERADALIEGFRPGVTERLGLGPDLCLERNPRLVYGRITGWGQTGPLAQSAGHDINYVALTGALHAIGPRDGKPVPPLNLVGDFGGGAMYLALGLVSAMLEARTSGRGQVIDAAMVDGVASLMASIFGRFAAGQWQDRRGENVLDGGVPWYGVYETQDGLNVAIGALEDPFFALLCCKIGLDSSFIDTRRDPSTWPALREQFIRIFRSRTRAEWCTLLEGTDACFTPVLSIAEAPLHPHNLARGNFLRIDGVIQPAPAPRFSRTSYVPDGSEQDGRNPSAAAADLAAVWGLDEQTLSRFQQMGAVR